MRTLLVAVFFGQLSFACFSQQQPTYTSSEILLQLKKLNVLGSVLYIAAHPDDENNTLLPYLANEKMYRTGYLSLTRGDGGQNLIGDEQGVELGLIRTQELIAARKVDGAEQYFSRAYEFGFSKSAEEALRTWDKEKILADVVWVIRNYQPDIIIKRFPPDSRAGHGHHAASAILADEAFTAAADPNRFPEQFQYGVKPWQAKRILWNTYNFGNNNTTSENQLKIDIGGYNTLLGKSYGELGGEARTMHKSQGEGRPRRRGQIFEYFLNTAGDAPTTGLMDGIEIGWKRIAGGEAIEKMINDIISNYKIEQPELSVPALVNVYKSVKELPAGVWRSKKLQELQQVIEACAALYVEATTSQQRYVQGDSVKITFSLNERKDIPVTLKQIGIEGFDSSLTTKLQANQNFSINHSLQVGNKPISQPYWLQYPMKGGTFDVRNQLLIGKAENDPVYEVKFTVNINGEDFIIRRPVQYRVIDPVKGDTYQPIAILPKMELRYTADNFIAVNGAPAKATINLKSNTSDSTAYTIGQQYSGKWVNDEPLFQYVSKNNPDENKPTVFESRSQETNTTEEIHTATADGKFSGYSKTIAYDHIPVITYFPQAKANLVKLDVKLVGKKIGYIAGAGDKVPQALEQMGYSVKMLTEADITDENLGQFDAIITGIRAYNINEFLTNKNEVLKRYVEHGGNMIVQYLKSNMVGQKRINAGPYLFTIDGGSRVTEEDAVVNFLLPDHPALNFPNKITAKDFEGWIQERSTYQVIKADEHFEMLLGMNDKGEKESNGSLAIARYGKGNFVYAGLVFFRELPAGVPGAYRLMANLVALPKNK